MCASCDGSGPAIAQEVHAEAVAMHILRRGHAPTAACGGREGDA